MRKKRILVAALNWGLGHAARCIPLIKALEKEEHKVFIASDGAALSLLQKEFPELSSSALPPYGIKYSTKGNLLKWKLLLSTPQVLQAIKAEERITRRFVKEHNIDVIISDSRFGVRDNSIKNIFITHQLKVLSGSTTLLSSKLHQKYIEKYDECWIPDNSGPENLSGILGHVKKPKNSWKYIGPLSRFEKQERPNVYDYLILLSGPEPQRTLLENLLLDAIKNSSKQILFIRGTFEEEVLNVPKTNILLRNHLFGKELEEAINSSKLVIARSGYTTLMDLAKLEKRAFFIPTPGQPEQGYLAQRLENLSIAPYCRQEEFSLEKLDDVEKYFGLRNIGSDVSFREFFTFF